MDKLETIQCDLTAYKFILQFRGKKTPLIVHFDTPSRRFYLSLIALIIIEMKKKGGQEFVHIHRHQKILTLLDNSLSGNNASKNVEGMWAKINMAWRHRLPNLESAVLFKVLDRDLISPWEKGGKYRYQCSEAECDAWAGLFSYDENNKWRFKIAFDSASVGLDDISVTLGNLRDNPAWEAFIDRLGSKPASDMTVTEQGTAATAKPLSKDGTGRTRVRKIIWGWAAVVVVAIIAIFMWRLSLYNTQTTTESVDLSMAVYPPIDKPSLAVLPFENLTGDPGQAYFSDGISDQLITSLSQGPYLYVTARTSSFAYQGKSMTAPEIAEELGVRYLLEGSVQRDAERVRINVQLIDGRSGNHVWAEHYDRKSDDLFALQDEITMGVMAALNLKITGFVAGSLKITRPSNLKAYEYYLQGIYYHLGRRTKDIAKARSAFKEAIKHDPDFAAAYRLLALVYTDEITRRTTKTPEKVFEKAEQAARKAHELDPEYPPYVVWSYLSTLKKDADTAILYGKKGVEQAPNNPYRYYFLGQAQHLGERFEEANATFETALQLAPFRPVNYVYLYAWSFVGMKEYNKAIVLFSEVVERGPKSFYAYLSYKGLAASYELSGNHDKATWAAANVLRMNPKYSLSKEKKLSPAKDGVFKETIFDAYRRSGLK